MCSLCYEPSASRLSVCWHCEMLGPSSWRSYPRIDVIILASLLEYWRPKPCRSSSTERSRFLATDGRSPALLTIEFLCRVGRPGTLNWHIAAPCSTGLGSFWVRADSFKCKALYACGTSSIRSHEKQNGPSFQALSGGDGLHIACIRGSLVLKVIILAYIAHVLEEAFARSYIPDAVLATHRLGLFG